MSKGIKIASGFAAAIAIGAGGGYALGPISDSIAAHETKRERASIGENDIKIEEADGDIRVLGPDGGWIGANAGETLAPPSCIEAVGVLSTFRATLGRAQISAGHGARVLMGEKSSALQLDRGQLKVSGGRISTYVPRHRMKIAGSNYGVWIDEERAIIAVLEGEVEVTSRGEVAKYAGGREVVYQGKTITPRVLDAQLTIQVDDELNRAGERRISATVAPYALVYQKNGDRYERVSVPSSGKITVTLAGKEPSPGELVAFDAAGRSAHLGGTPEAVKAALEGEAEEKTIEPEAPPAPPPPPVEKVEKKEKKKKKAPKPAPLVKEEAKPPPLPEERELPPVEETLEPEVREEDEDPTLRQIEEENEKVD